MSSPSVPGPMGLPAPTSGRPFDALAAELAEEQLADNPTTASALGLTAYDALLPDMSAAAVTDRERREDGWLDRFASLSDVDLTADEAVERDLVVMVLRGRALMRDWADWRRSADHYSGAALSGVYGLLLHRLTPEPELARSVAARLRATPELLAAGTANLDPDLADPTLLRRALGQISAGAAYARSVHEQFGPDVDGGRARSDVADAGETAAAAFERFGAHVADLAERAHGDWAIGEQRYDGLLANAEGLSYGAREMRDKGQAAYDEILADMRRRTADLGGGTHDTAWRELLETFSADHPATPEAMLEAYREAAAQARAFCAERGLVTMPEGERCDVVPSAPFTRPMIAVAHYITPPPFADRNVGHFFVPYPPDGATPEQVQQRLATNHHHGLWSIAVHEAYPGHHWHFAHLTAKAAGGQGRVLRMMFGSTYFVEGWGLYTEDLMREEGFFTTPERELAQRDFRLFRAARIIVDTSLHLGEMTVEEAVGFMSTKASLSRDTARAEVLRYCAWPTQAASYLTGALEIARMREDWVAQGLGSAREFHDMAAGSGRLPIELVERTLFGRPAVDRNLVSEGSGR